MHDVVPPPRDGKYMLVELDSLNSYMSEETALYAVQKQKFIVMINMTRLLYRDYGDK